MLTRGGDPLSPRQTDRVRRMGRASRRLLDMVTSLLERARIESGRLAVEPEDLDLAALAAEVVEDQREQAERKGLAITFASQPPVARVTTDARLARLIIANLVTNAIKFTERGSVGVSIAKVGDGHRLEVCDTGAGIPEGKLDAIFEPFEQVEPVAAKHSTGVGLGLTIVASMVRALGGDVRVRSTLNRGSCFSVMFVDVTRS
jgi:signal transduction histidine kinase